MKTSGAFVVCKTQQEKILLVKRRDWPLWDLPGGRVEKGENPEQAAERECLEESGFRIRPAFLSGIYVNKALGDVQFIFAGEIIGGKALVSGPETAEVRFFSASALPLLMIPHRCKQIKNLLAQGNLPPKKPLELELRDAWLVRFFKKH
ncbi:NUDIX hydrolase [Lactococcus kimchii]|uniref:NUDIX hydrolase n=1 Tax=Lactococcus sp. S-13 TaxID=2507158 RepID=UPI00102353E7|nr:NUDIX domain-containing protein [Lactococcus sp. S-13]RZI48724.1 NUDIX domain-containing protein [Lactococcus sp. S-13]